MSEEDVLIVRRIVNDMPTYEAFEAVRCKDCRHGRHDELLGCYWCQGITRDADFFCKFGERGESNLFTDADAMELLERGEKQ